MTARADAAAPPLALRLPLQGSRLIEASAGTGKTWTIAALYLRLVLGHGGAAHDPVAAPPFGPLTPPHILVLTFTRAATQELSARIRERLHEATRFFRGQIDQADALLHALRAHYPPGPTRELAAWRLELAAQGMDEAAIHTIDAWCHKVLQDHAALTGQLGQAQLGSDSAQLWLMAALDFWRNHVYPLHGEVLQRAQALWPNAQHWLAQSRRLQKAPFPEHAAADAALAGQALGDWLAQALQEQQALLTQCAAGWDEKADRLQGWLDAQIAAGSPHKSLWDGRKLQARFYQPWLEALRQWARQQPPAPQIAGLSDTARQRLSLEGLQQVRHPQAAPLTPQELPEEIAQLQALLQRLDQLPDLGQAAQAFALAATRQRWQQLKAQQGVMDFDDLLLRVQQALAGAHGAALRAQLLAQYPAAMIDEFQDTSPGQYQIFNALYQPERDLAEHALLLIGDPKQSIYGFRGADIHSYLAAKRQTQGRHDALDTNFRSSQALVQAVNHVFSQAELRPGPGAFRFRDHEGQPSPLPFEPVRAQGLGQWLGPQQAAGAQALAAMTLCAPEQALPKDEAWEHFAQLCAEQIVTWLQRERLTLYEADAGGRARAVRRLQPGDIAILVHSQKDAALLQRALRQRQLHAVYLSGRESVYASAQARDLLLWLQAVAQPGDVARARAAFATALLGWPLPSLLAGAEQEALLDAQLQLLQQLQRIWRRQGVLPMLRHSIHQLGLARQWLAAEGGHGERTLTNVLHLAELLQQASASCEAEHQLIRYFSQQIQQAQQGADGAMQAEEQIVRLESDAQLIQIVTIHKSKGLEYPVVMLPFASHGERAPSASNARTPATPRHAGQDAGEEERREALRLLYVALTRARHALWLGVPIYPGARAKVNALHRSALGYLVHGDSALDDAQWLPQLRAWAAPCAAIQVQAAAAHAASTRYQPEQPQRHWRQPQAYPGHTDQHFAIASFSALARELQPPGPAAAQAEAEARMEAAPQPAPHAPADTLTLLAPPAILGAQDEWPSMPAGAAWAAPTEPPVPPAQRAAPAWHALRGSAQLGNWMHQALEWLQAEGFAAQLGPAQAARLQRQATLAGMQQHWPALQQWLNRLLATPLPLQAAAAPRLCELERSLPEMEFWLPVAQQPQLASAQAIDAICRAHLWPGLERPALQPRQWHGMLMGAADLVLEHRQRFWVLDYKSNRLGPGPASYHAAALREAMLAHRYDVQALLYGHALHRLLRQRLPGYDSRQHLGGLLYWFLRGADHADGGLLHLPLPAAALAELDALLAAPESV
ncbi:MAG: exodeoxyribonuclease V subunit beta [Comamonadaceae bacterium]|nr:exodeoxyribonuclease V subunit beta [Comamonadaceae bacterium]